MDAYHGELTFYMIDQNAPMVKTYEKIFPSLFTPFDEIDDLDEIDVVSCGDRDPESDGVDGISATQLREAAMDGDMDSFCLGLPDDLSPEDSKSLFLAVVDGLVD